MWYQPMRTDGENLVFTYTLNLLLCKLLVVIVVIMQKGAAKIYSIGGCRELLIQLGMSSCQLLKIYLHNLLAIQLFQKVIIKYGFMCYIAVYACITCIACTMDPL